eukprot:m.30647 g.30647  ORF g.30647 m.30647 type:complete len:313 (+) comp8222_c0_seq1:59-997(+)
MDSKKRPNPSADSKGIEKRLKGDSKIPDRVLFVARHAERLDRSMESKGESWVTLASRPHDPPISEHGKLQAKLLGEHFKTFPDALKPSIIVCSPLTRTIQTAEEVANVLDLGTGTICVEEGLCEEAKSMRFPAPPYLLRNGDAMAISKRIRYSYRSTRPVVHRWDPAARIRDLRREPHKLKQANGNPEIHGLRELHPTLEEVDTGKEDQSSVLEELNAITYDRCKETARKILENPDFLNERILLVSHGAVTRNTIQSLTGKRMSGVVGSFVTLEQKDGSWFVGNQDEGAETMGTSHLAGIKTNSSDTGDKDV